MVPEGAGEVSGWVSLQLLEILGVCDSAKIIFTAAYVLISKFPLFIKTWVTFDRIQCFVHGGQAFSQLSLAARTFTE